MARNKAHKQRFASKHSIARKAQGRTASSSSNSKQTKGSVSAVASSSSGGANTVTQASFKGGHAAGNKQRSRQSSEALRKNKNEIVRATKSIGFDGPPRICGLVNANESGDCETVFHSMVEVCGKEPVELGVPVTMIHEKSGSASQQPLRLTVVCEGNDYDEQVAIDIAKVSDVVIFALDCSMAVQETLQQIRGESEQNQEFENRTQATWFSDVGLCITDQTRELVQYMNAQGSPSIVVVLQGLDSYENEPRKRRQVERLHERYFESVLCSEHRVVSDLPTLMRTLETLKLRKVHFREIRPYFVADDGDYDESSRELHLSGYLRGANLSAKQLVHITNHGTFQIRQVMAPGDPCPVAKSSVPPLEGVIETSLPDEREPLVEIQASDSVLNEDEEGVPTAADVFHAAQEREVAEKAEKQRMYAAAAASGGAHGTGDNENENNNNRHNNNLGGGFLGGLGLGEGNGNDERMLGQDQQVRYDAEEGNQQQQEEEEEGQGQLQMRRKNSERGGDNFSVVSGGGKSEIEFKRSADILRFEKQTEEEREEDMRNLREQAEEQEASPDEMDTPFHIPARQRFAKFRGMKSFHTGKWDPNENLPLEFGHIFKFRGFSSVRDQSVKLCQEYGPAPVGCYIRITLVDVPPSLWDNASDLMLVSGLLQHEHKWSVCHFRTQRNTEFPDPIKSKTPMLTHVGFRKFFTQPLWSEPVSMGGGRTKFSRYYFPGDTFKHASFFGPISYYPCPILMFRAVSLEEQQEGVPPPLVCWGAALPPDPDFLILKRIVLTGKIAVIYKKQLVVRYMFWNEEDVRYFQPIEVYTRLGRRGKITKPLGTHGMFKCELNDNTQQHDTICLDLWKRVFPKWKTVPYNVAEIADSTEILKKQAAQEDDVFVD